MGKIASELLMHCFTCHWKCPSLTIWFFLIKKIHFSQSHVHMIWKPQHCNLVLRNMYDFFGQNGKTREM